MRACAVRTSPRPAPGVSRLCSRARRSRLREALVVGGIAAQLIAQPGDAALGALIGREGADQRAADGEHADAHGGEQPADGTEGVPHAAHGLGDLAALLGHHLEGTCPTQQRGDDVVDLRRQLLRLPCGHPEGVGGLVGGGGDRLVALLQRHQQPRVIVEADQAEFQRPVKLGLGVHQFDGGLDRRVGALRQGGDLARGLIHPAGDAFLGAGDLVAGGTQALIRALDLPRASNIAGGIERGADDRQQLDAAHGPTHGSSSSRSASRGRVAARRSASTARRSPSSARTATISAGCSGTRMVRHHASTSRCWMGCGMPLSV
jgi:hypothetical protein